MSDTATRDDRAIQQLAGPAAPQLAPPKLRRRPAMIAAAAAAICLGALLAGWAWTATTNSHEVLVARHTIERGTVVEASDLARVRVGTDPALKPLPASELARIVGQRAALDISEGALLTPDSVTSKVVPGADQSVVGVALTPAQAPGLALRSGDTVRVVVTPAQGDDLPAGAPLVNEAEVVGSRVDDATGQIVVDLLVSHADAAVLATRVATGHVALILDSREH